MNLQQQIDKYFTLAKLNNQQTKLLHELSSTTFKHKFFTSQAQEHATNFFVMFTLQRLSLLQNNVTR